jgi:hyperosmotically inducible periplasmic protein
MNRTTPSASTSASTHATTLLATAAAALMLMACGKTDDGRTAGQKLDAAVAKTEQSAEEAKNKTEAAVDKMGAKVENATDRAATMVEDATITASIKAELAKDPTLSALKINVDTRDGLVSLNGSAPDSGSRERASRLVSGVKGVKSVDNKLIVNG